MQNVYICTWPKVASRQVWLITIEMNLDKEIVYMASRVRNLFFKLVVHADHQILILVVNTKKLVVQKFNHYFSTILPRVRYMLDNSDVV